MKYLISILFTFYYLGANAQLNQTGLSLIRHFSKSIYNAGRQNWSITQDSRGFIYIANNNGLLRYDGSQWNLFSLPNNQLVRSVMCSGDTIYVGAFEEIGYFTYDQKLDLVYHSLMGLVPRQDAKFDEAWRIYKIGTTVIFQTFTHVIEYRIGEISAHKAPELLQFSFRMGKNFYVQGKEGTIYSYHNGNYEKFEDKGIFKGKQIWSSLKLSDGTILLATINDGVWIYDGNSFIPWKGMANELLKTYQIFSASRTPDGVVAFGTIQNGLIITDEQGNLINLINKSKGLHNNTVLSTFVDRTKNLWLGLDNGIDYVEISSPLSFLGEGLGLEGVVYAAKIFNGKIFVGTNQGLYVAPWPIPAGIGQQKPFQLVPQTKGQVWSLFEDDGRLYCGHNFGTFVIDKNQNVSRISTEEGSWTFLPLRSYPSYMIVGKYKGLNLYTKTTAGWRYLKKISGFDESSRMIVEDENESIWMAHGYKGIFKIILNRTKDSVRFVTLYDDSRGFPERVGVNIEKIGNQIVFLTMQGVYRYNSLTDRMEPYVELNNLIGNATNIRKMVEDDNGNIWILKSNSLLQLIKHPEGTKTVTQTPVSRFGENFVAAFENIYLHQSNAVFVGTENGLICYNPQYSSGSDVEPFFCMVKNLSSLGRQDHVIFNDYGISGNKNIYLLHSENSIQIVATAPIYSFGEINYSFWLKGYESDWTEWTRSNIKNYSGLPFGEYELRVIARDAMGRISKPAIIHIKIGLPWYLSWFFVVIYAMLLVAGFYLLRFLVRRKVQRATARVREQKNLEFKIQEEEHKRQVLEAEREIIRLKSENLQAQVDHKNQELAAIALQIAHKNDFLERIKHRLENIAKAINPVSQREVLELIRNIDNDIKMDKEWLRFEQHFDEVHTGFIKKLKESYPDLTPTELRLCAYLRLNMTTKDIAQIMNISVRGVEISRYRLRKKLNLETDTNLVDFMLKL